MNQIYAKQDRQTELLNQARTANEVAAALYPEIAQHYSAFTERRVSLGDLSHLEFDDLNESFWASTLGHAGSGESPFLFATQENQFRRYHPDHGCYLPVKDSVVQSELLKNLDDCAKHFPSRVNLGSYQALKSRQRMKAVVERAKCLLAADDDCFQLPPNQIAVSNGILNLTTNTLLPFSPATTIKQTIPVKFDPEARCDCFLGFFLQSIEKPEEVDLLQRYLSQILDGQNHSQTILILNGEAGWGKSTLMRIIGGIFGWDSAGIIREQLFKNDHELSRYQGKRFLYHPDCPTDFLDRKEASMFKQIVGGDPMWTEDKSGNTITIEGRFSCILACNGKLKIRIDEDAEAWMRRLLVVPFRQPSHDCHFGKTAEAILRGEASGILNWLLEGRRKLVKAKFQMTQTEDQKRRTKMLVMASQSPRAFVRTCLERKEGAEMSGGELYASYQRWCVENEITPFAGQFFTQMAKDEIEITLGLRYRHDLESEGKVVRGWKNLAVTENQIWKKESKVSGE